MRSNCESNVVVENEVSNGGKKRSNARKRKSTFDFVQNSLNNSDDLISGGLKSSGENLKKKRKLSTGKQTLSDATTCDDSNVINSCGATATTSTSTTTTAATLLTSSSSPSPCASSIQNTLFNKSISPAPSSSSTNNLKLLRDKTRPLTVNTNYDTISSSKRRKEEIISRALVSLQSQWRERFLQSQQTTHPTTNILKTNNSHNSKVNAPHSKSDQNGRVDDTDVSINDAFVSKASSSFDSNNCISSTSGNISGSKLHCISPSNESPGGTSSGPSNSILRQPRLQVNQSTLNHIRNTHRNSLESSSRDSISSVSSESSVSPSDDSDSESSYEGSSSEEEDENGEDDDDDEKDSVSASSEEEEEEENESSSNDESSDSNLSCNYSIGCKKKVKSFKRNEEMSSAAKKTNANSSKLTGKKTASSSLENVNKTPGNMKKVNGTASTTTTATNGNSNIKSKKSTVEVERKKVESKITSKNRNENGCKSKKKNPGTITCAICFTVKYYSHKQRRFGQFSCEPCSKFFASFLRSPRAYFCEHTGNVICFYSSLFPSLFLFFLFLYLHFIAFLFFHSLTLLYTLGCICVLLLSFSLTRSQLPFTPSSIVQIINTLTITQLDMY